MPTLYQYVLSVSAVSECFSYSFNKWQYDCLERGKYSNTTYLVLMSDCGTVFVFVFVLAGVVFVLVGVVVVVVVGVVCSIYC